MQNDQCHFFLLFHHLKAKNFFLFNCCLENEGYKKVSNLLAFEESATLKSQPFGKSALDFVYKNLLFPIKFVCGKSRGLFPLTSNSLTRSLLAMDNGQRLVFPFQLK